MNAKRKRSGQVRIIGGRWRGRRLHLAADSSLRPSPDRVRETLFNWLNPTIDGALCLDLFAGSGALGFEALSRGAAALTLVENDAASVALLTEHQQMLGADTAVVLQQDAFQWLGATTPQAFDLVFLDPPYALNCLVQIAAMLTKGWLKPHARVYLEAQKIPILELEARGLKIVREGRTRQVHYALAELKACAEI